LDAGNPALTSWAYSREPREGAIEGTMLVDLGKWFLLKGAFSWYQVPTIKTISQKVFRSSGSANYPPFGGIKSVVYACGVG